MLNAPQPRIAIAESLPPSIDNVFEVVDISSEIAEAGFYADCGNTCWWGNSTPRIENYGHERAGYHVDRRRFDALLVSLAQRAGAVVQQDRHAPRIALSDVKTSFILDASGRAGVLARQVNRLQDTRYRTIALCGFFRAKSPWLPDPHHTLIEAYDRGWAWSVPLDRDRRQVSFMVDPESVHGPTRDAFHAELARTTHFSRLFDHCELEAEPVGRDASMYHAERHAGPNWILAGDAGSFVEPLSSFGVKKAMVSAWTAAVVVNTCLRRSDMAQAAIEMFNARESEAWLDHARQAAQYFGDAAAVFGTSFWQARAKPPATVLYRNQELQEALQRLRGAESVKFCLSEKVRREERPAICGREVRMLMRAVLPGLPNTEYMQGVHLTTLAEMAQCYLSVGEFYNAYVEKTGETPLPNFLAALSLLVARDVLRIRG